MRETAWKGQVRLCARYRRLQAAGKRPQVVVTAIAREMGGVCLGHWPHGRTANRGGLRHLSKRPQRRSRQTDETLGRGGGTVRGTLGRHYGEASHRSPPLDRGSPATIKVIRYPTRASELDQPSLVIVRGSAPNPHPNASASRATPARRLATRAYPLKRRTSELSGRGICWSGLSVKRSCSEAHDL
jgi:hypothetical protein